MPVVRVVFDDDGAREQLGDLVRVIQREADAVVVAAAERTALPLARSAARSPYRGLLRAVPSRGGAVIRVVGPRVKVRTAGWLEFGGSIRGKRERVGWSTYSSLKTGRTRRRRILGDSGLMTFRVDGRWVSTRVVTRPRTVEGRYVGRAVRNPGVVSRVEADIRRGIDGVFRRYLAPPAEVR